MSWLITLALTYVICVLLFHLYIRFYVQKHDPTRQYLPTVVVPWYFPFFGPILSMLDIETSLKHWRAKYGENFTLRLAGRNLTFIPGDANLKKFYHASEEQLSLVGAASATLGDKVPENQYLGKYNSVPYLQIILSQPYLTTMGSKIEGALFDYFNAETGSFWIQHGGNVVVDFMDFIYRLVIRMNCENFTSRRVYEEHVDEIIKIFSLLDTERYAMNPVREELKRLLKRDTDRSALWRRWIELLLPDIDRCLKMIENNIQPEEYDVAYQAVRFSMDELKNDGESFTPRLVAFVVYMTFFPAQLNTYSAAGLFLLQYMVHEHDEIGQEIREEIEQVTSHSNGDINLDDLNNMTYIEACIYETIRLGNNAQLWVRHAGQDFLLSDDTYIPAGNLVMVSLAGSRLLYSEPEKFDPQRHLPPREEGKTHPYRIVPFGRGKHPCTGERYVKMQIKLLLINILKMCHLELMKESLDYQRTMDEKRVVGLNRPSKPVYVRISKRNR